MQELLFATQPLVADPSQLPPRVCPLCPASIGLQPASAFGVCRQRKDGKNLYCKVCIRKKLKDQRRTAKEYRSRRPVAEPLTEQLGELAAPIFTLLQKKLSPVERVKAAIRKGAVTQKEIRKATGIGEDEVGAALAELLLWTREIRSVVVGQTRHYVMNDASVLPLRETALGIPERKADVQATFSQMKGLMPGKRKAG